MTEQKNNDRTITLSPEKMRLVMMALHAVSPTGSGSDTFHLANEIGVQTDLDIRDDEFWQRVGSMQSTATDEYLAHVGYACVWDKVATITRAGEHDISNMCLADNGHTILLFDPNSEPEVVEGVYDNVPLIPSAGGDPN